MVRLNGVQLWLVVCVVLSFVSAASATEASFWTGSGLNVWLSSDSVSAGETVYAEQSIHGQVTPKSGTLNGASISIYPGGQPIGEWWGQPQPYFHWTSGVGLWTATGPMDPSSPQMNAQLNPIPGTVPFAPEIGVSRSISNPVFGSDTDTETRTVMVTLTVPFGSLTGYNNLGVNLVNNWNIPQGLSITNVSSMTNNAGFTPDTTHYQFSNGTISPPSLSGTYTFSADVTFLRSGALSQSTYGTMHYEPAASTNYSQSSSSLQSGTSATQTLGGNTITASAQDSTTWSCNAEDNRRQLQFPTVLAQQEGALSVSEIDLMKSRQSGLSGNVTYQFECNVDGSNIVSGTLKTPGGTVYDLGIEDDWLGVEFRTVSEIALEGMGFINGPYTITLQDAQGNPTIKTFSLSGDYPSETPTLDQAGMDTINRSPTLSWSAPNDPNINAVAFEICSGADYDQFKLITDPNLLQSDTSWTPPEDMDYGGYSMSTYFVNAQVETTPEGDISSVVGYLSGADSYINVVPEPAALLVLALGGVGLLRKRRGI